MKKFVISMLLILLLFFCGCVSIQKAEKGLDKLMHKEPEEAFQVLGYPSKKKQFGDDTVYIWVVDRQGSVIVPQTAYTSGTFGTTRFYSQTTTSQTIPVHSLCKIKLVEGEYGRLKRWEYKGNRKGCRQFFKRLVDYYEQQ